MATTAALYTGLSGLSANSRWLDVSGNNIANANTTAYKTTRLAFENQFSRTLSAGSQPSSVFGGSNPTQIGYGVSVAGTQRSFAPGPIEPTGDARDLAIDGNGFFVVDDGGTQVYTRAGSFRPNENNILTTVTGETLMGYGVDDNFTINQGVLQPIEIPLGTLTIAEPTTVVQFAGNLDADGTIATRGAQLDLMGTSTAGLATISTATVPPATGDLISAAGLLTEIEDPALPGTDTPLFTVGQIIEIDGAERGDGSSIGPVQYTITATSTLDELAMFLSDAFGIDSSMGTNPDGSTPGVSIDATNGRIRIDGNIGSVNDIDIEATDLRLLDSTGDLIRSPFVVDEVAEANGESVRTSVTVYDSLGTPLVLDLTMVLSNTSSSGTDWTYFVSSEDDSDASGLLTSGTLSFDTNGQLTTTDPINVLLDRANSGAATPLNFQIDLSSGSDRLTALTDTNSTLGAIFRDGAPIGELTTFAVGGDGVITGIFANGLTRTIGQVPLATFTNQEGLLDLGGNLFSVAPNSGEPVITTAGQFGSGQLISGALEGSNVDLSQEFINLILASTGYNASSRVIQESDELLQQLLLIGR
ncbi:MAG: flagellar hook-basal body complex protein [Planctomycetota bacterium]